MQSNKPLLKTISIVVIIVAIIFIVGFTLVSSRDGGMSDSQQAASYRANQEAMKAITASSSVEADMDSYLKSSNNVPDSNEFNDSYSDLN